jgi:hypothetical protein
VIQNAPQVKPNTEARVSKRSAAWLFILLGCIYTLASSGRVRTPDEYMPFFQAQSLVERGSTTIPQAVQFGDLYGAFDRHGHPRAAYPAGQAFLSVPLLMLGKFLLTRLPGVPTTPGAVFYIQVFGAVLTSAFAAAAAMAFFFLTTFRLGVSLRNALLATLCVAFGTLIFPYSGYFFSEPFTALIMIAAVYVVVSPSPQMSGRNALVIGLLLGLAIWIRPTMVFATGMFALGMLLRDGIAGLRRAVVVCAIPAISGLLYLLSNKIVFGRAFNFGYPETEEMLGKHLNSFHTPFYVGLTGFLISPGKSIFIFMPVLLLAIFGMRRLWRRDRAVATVSAGLPLLYLLFYMRYTQWEGGVCPGPRYLLPFLIVTCVPVGLLLETGQSRFRQWLLVLTAAGFAVQVITYSTSFLEDQAVSVGAYYDSKLNYRMSYDPLVSQTKRLIEYLNGKPASLGFGFDRWFVFLHKMGIAISAELLIAAVPLLLFLFSLSRLRRLLAQDRLSGLEPCESGVSFTPS